VSSFWGPSQGISPNSREGWGSEQIHVGTSESKSRSTDNVERFLFILRLENQGDW